MQKLLTQLIGLYLNTINFIFPKVGGKQAFFVFCYPFKAKLSPKQQAYLNSARRQQLSVEGSAVPLYSWGEGNHKILFVHGWQSNTYRWRRYIDQIDTSRFTVYSIDAPGHGNADSKFGNVPLFEKTIHEAVKTIGSVDVMVGHSIGSFSIQYFLHNHPNFMPRKFVSLASPGRAVDFIEVMIETVGLSSRSVENMRTYFKQYAGREPEYYDIKNFAPKISAESLIVHDTSDRDAPVAYAYALHQLIPDSKLRVTDKLGHRLIDQELLEEILLFINSIGTRAKSTT